MTLGTLTLHLIQPEWVGTQHGAQFPFVCIKNDSLLSQCSLVVLLWCIHTFIRCAGMGWAALVTRCISIEALTHWVTSAAHPIPSKRSVCANAPLMLTQLLRQTNNSADWEWQNVEYKNSETLEPISTYCSVTLLTIHRLYLQATKGVDLTGLLGDIKEDWGSGALSPPEAEAFLWNYT